MRRKSFLSFVVILYMVSFGLTAQNPERLARLQSQIYRGFITNDMVLWERTIGELERYAASNPGPEGMYDLLLARYGYIAFTMEKEPGKARQHLDKAEAELEKLFNYTPYLSNAYALQGAFLGFRISLRPIVAVRLGPRSYRVINSAVEKDFDNPTAWMEMANSRFYTPSAFGGSKQEALEYYMKAVALFEKDMKPNQKWLYLNCLVGLAKSYQYTDRKIFAIATYRKALTFEPEFKWVRDELLPQILN